MALPALIAIDLDGTLLDGAAQLTDRSLAAVRAIAAAGVHVVIATGRPPNLLDALGARLAGVVGHVVATNGSTVARLPDEPDGAPELLHLIGFGLDRARAAVVAVRRVDPGFGFALATDAGFAHEHGFAERMPAAVAGEPIDDVLTHPGSTAFKLIAFHRTMTPYELITALPAVVNDGDGHEPLHVAHLGADAVEIGPASTDKAAGLRWLCEHLGVDRRAVTAIGDEWNDLTMIEWAGCGVAMGNADERVRAAADLVIGRNTDEGVAAYLEHLLTIHT